MEPHIAVVADGRLTLLDQKGGKTLHSSDFGEGIQRRAEKLAEKSAWKNSGDASFGMPSTWGSQSQAPQFKPRINAVFPGKSGNHFCYILVTDTIGAFLDYNPDEDYEHRIFHKESFFASSFDRHPETRELLCHCGPGSAVSQVARLNPDGRELVPLTEGDSVDAAPVWDLADDDFIYYHSAGVAYDQSGNYRGMGPHAILRLNHKKGRLTTVIESESWDFICPRSDKDGALYYIKRPYEGPEGAKAPLLTTIKDTLLLPFRLLRSFFDFFQIFSMLVSKKPLMTGGGAKVSGPEPLEVWIHGRLLSQDKADADGSLAPGDWKLVRRSPSGEEEVLASKVAAYDLSAENGIVYSDGRNVFKLENGKSEQIARIPLTSEVRWLQ